MKLFTVIILMAAVYCVSGNRAYSQDSYQDDAGAMILQQRVTGTVTNEMGDPMPGATVQVEGTTIGQITGVNGEYSVEIPDANAVLVFSFVGYDTQTIPVAGQTVINVSLEPSVESLQEVVVIGYGTQKRTTITGSVSIVKGEDVAKVPVANITNSIAGKLAGVSMRPRGGQPGDDNPSIYIRGIGTMGESEPLIVVDGVVRDNINQIDPTIIESISILKDAAAVAPYGLGGANGVVLITTKGGDVMAPTLTLNAYYGVQSPTYYPDLLDAKDYMRMHNEAYLNENPGMEATKPYSDALLNDYDNLHASDPDLYPDSNTDDLVDLTIPLQNYNLQLSGGNEKTKYFAGIGYFQQDGVFEQVNYKRFNYNMRVEADVTNTTNVNLSLIGSKERRNDLDAASSSNQLFRNGYKFVPTEAIYYTNGKWGQFAGNSPVAVLNAGYEFNDGNTLLSSITIEQQLPFIKGLSIKGAASMDVRNNWTKGWHTPFYFWSQNTNTTPYTYNLEISTQEGGAPAYAYLRQTDTRRHSYTYQGYINYQRSFGLHDITGLVVAEAHNNTYSQLWAQRNNFAIMVDEMNMGSSDKADYDNGGASSEGASLGYVYRVGYVYDDKYMLEASGRYDGHYYFAPGSRWGYFPAFSLGWRVSEENFMQNVTWIDNLKLRGSWGKSGNLAGSAYQFLSGYTLRGNAYAFNGLMVQGASNTEEANPNITWEVSQKTDVGFEASMWNSLLTVEFDFFHELRTGMLLAPAVTVPFEYGLDLADENAGEMKNRGFELTLGSRYGFQNGLNLSINANLSMAKNEMVEMFETDATYNNPNRRRTGRPYQTQFGYHSLGFFQESDDTNGDGIIDLSEYPVEQFGELHPGDIKYEDISGPDGDMIPDGKIDSNDEVEIGYPQYPLMTFGFTPTADWKGFDLSLFFQGQGMVSRRVQNFQTVPFNNNNSNCDYEYFNDHWTPETPNATYPRATSSPYTNNTQGSDFWLWDASYLRLKTLTLGYTVPVNVTRFLTIQTARLYITGQNLFTVSKIDFMDPETAGDTSYPLMRSFTFGLNVTF